MGGAGITGLSVALNGHRQERRQGGPISCSEIRRPAFLSRTGIEGGQIAPHDVIDSFSFPFPGFSPDFLQGGAAVSEVADQPRSEEHTSELQSLMRISYAVFCLKKKN